MKGTFKTRQILTEDGIISSGWTLSKVHRFHDQAFARAERVYAERERIRLQPDNDYERFMSDVALRGLRQRRLDYVEESDVGDSDSSDQWHLGRFAEVQERGLLSFAEEEQLRWQAEADLEAHNARVASDAEWLEQTLRWHEDARREQEERDALADVDQ